MTVKRKYKINPHLSLKLEDTNPNSYRDWTVIYVDGEEFMQCHYLLITISKDNLSEADSVSSMDEAEEILGREQEHHPDLLTPEEEFFGHCSNIQAWYEHNYDTRLLHRFLAFPLLKRLNEVGDNQARKVFNEEIRIRLLSGADSVVTYLINEGYIEHFTLEEWKVLKEDFDEVLKKHVEATIIEILKTVGTPHIRKEILYQFLTILNENLASNLEFVEFNGERFFVNDGVLKFYITKDGKEKIQDISRISGLDEIANLKELYLWNQDIKEIKGIGNLKNLEVLNLRNNSIEKMKNLGNLLNLKKLNLARNRIKDIKGLSTLTNLNYLNLNQNRIKIVKGLENLKKLQTLCLSMNPIPEREKKDLEKELSLKIL